VAAEDRITDQEYRELQRRFGGQFVARRDGEAVVASPSFDDLIDAVEAMQDEQRERLIIEYIEPADSVRVY
jgi:hypothetical protein